MVFCCSARHLAPAEGETEVGRDAPPVCTAAFKSAAGEVFERAAFIQVDEARLPLLEAHCERVGRFESVPDDVAEVYAGAERLHIGGGAVLGETVQSVAHGMEARKRGVEELPCKGGEERRSSFIGTGREAGKASPFAVLLF